MYTVFSFTSPFPHVLHCTWPTLSALAVAATEGPAPAARTPPSAGGTLRLPRRLASRRLRSPSPSSSDLTDWSNSLCSMPSGTSSSDSPSLRPAHKRQRPDYRQPSPRGVDFQRLTRVAPLTRQPAPPRGLKLPTLSAAALETLTDSSPVASVNTVLLPHAPSTDGPRFKTQTSRYSPLSPAAYIRGVITFEAFRTYCFFRYGSTFTDQPDVAAGSGCSPHHKRAARPG